MLFAHERRMLLLSAVAVLLMLVFLAVAPLRSPDSAQRTAQHLAQGLLLTETALSPTGTPSRHPEEMRTGIDPRPAP